MQTLKLSVSMPDATHPDMELRLSATDSDCEVVIALPIGTRVDLAKPSVASVNPLNAVNDEYELGGYAGI
jgi:hypothetical protein